jgi:hypothetical protein
LKQQIESMEGGVAASRGREEEWRKEAEKQSQQDAEIIGVLNKRLGELESELALRCGREEETRRGTESPDRQSEQGGQGGQYAGAIAALRAQVLDLTAAHAEVCARLEDRLKEEVDKSAALRQNCSTLMRQVDQLLLSQASAERLASDLDLASRQTKDEASSLAAANDQLIAENKALHRRIDEVEQEMSILRAECAMAQSERSEWEERSKKETAELDKVKRQLDDANGVKSETLKKLRTMAAQMERDEQRIAALKGELASHASVGASGSASAGSSSNSNDATPATATTASANASANAGAAAAAAQQQLQHLQHLQDLQQQAILDSHELSRLRLAVDDLQRKKAHADTLARTDADTIAKLRQQLDALQLAERAKAAADHKRTKDIQEVNSILHAFADDSDFQSDLQRPLVKVALDLWGGAPHQYTEEQVNEVKTDEGVGRIFPLLKEFERVCDLAQVRFPMEHLRGRRKELTQEAVTYAFGPEFVQRYYVR